MDQTGLRPEELDRLEQAAVEITTRAAVLLREKLRGEIVVEFKDKHQRDPVTAVDRAVESLVRDEIRRRFPEHGILGEEGTGEGVASEYLWVLDPIDGTANFAAGLPIFGLSLALLSNGAPIVGCLYVPFWPFAEPAILSASLGRGARIGSETIQLKDGSFRPGGPVAVPPGLRAMFRTRGEFKKRPGEARNLGSIVAELAMVATGGFQFAVFGGPRLWDVAAGMLIVREAGGEAFTWEGHRWRRLSRFRAPIAKPKEKAKSLRDWVQPVLVTTPAATRHVASGLAPRRPPPPAVRWLFSRRRKAMDWLKRRGQPARQAKPTGPPVAASAAASSNGKASPPSV
jgi:myo-inositol-1(or 4)-monophosphatase